MKKILLFLSRIVKWTVILVLVYLTTLFFREQHIPGPLVESAISRFLPTNVVVGVGRASVGFSDGLRIFDFKIYDEKSSVLCEPVFSFGEAAVNPLTRKIFVEGLKYLRLPESYYADGNAERSEQFDLDFPGIGEFDVFLLKPNILSLCPEYVKASVSVSPKEIDIEHIRLKWSDVDRQMKLEGFCKLDLSEQAVYGEVDGGAKQINIRPFIEALDLPVALPYMDAFTEVQGAVPAKCSWRVNLVNSDFDLYLHLRPVLGKYNGVAMRNADGKIHLHVYTRGNSLNYRHELGPISAVSAMGKALDGTVNISGTNGFNVVEVNAQSGMPVADLLRIGGFDGQYVDGGCFGESKCRLRFEFPRSMTNNYEVLNGSGHVEIKNGQLMRFKGFSGLLELLADKVPSVSWFTDSTQASCDYKIDKGVLSTENLYIEGSVFSIKMYGTFDAARDALDFTVRVQFTKKDSFVGKLLHPITWPFTKLLLEFKLEGSSEKPEWKYLSVIDRVVEVVK